MNSSPPWWMLPALAVAVESIFAGALVASCFIGNETLQTTMFTAAVAQAVAATGYFFGSSSGSAKKDETIAQQGQALAVSSPAQPQNGANP